MPVQLGRQFLTFFLDETQGFDGGLDYEDSSNADSDGFMDVGEVSCTLHTFRKYAHLCLRCVRRSHWMMHGN